MKETNIRNDFTQACCYLLSTIMIGAFVVVFKFNNIENFFVSYVQNIILDFIPIQVFVIITYLGDLRLLLIISTLYFAYSYYRLKRWDNAFKQLAFLAIVTLFAFFLKELFRRERPFIYSDNIVAYTDDNGFSYPSGHVSRSLGFYYIFSGRSRIMNIIAIILSTLISLSRIVLGAHYITDLIGAIFLTLFSLKATNIALHIVNMRFKIFRT
ncbi:MAG: phosphatase PAP2 family protein [Nitrososphaeria archaeon]